MCNGVWVKMGGCPKLEGTTGGWPLGDIPTGGGGGGIARGCRIGGGGTGGCPNEGGIGGWLNGGTGAAFGWNNYPWIVFLKLKNVYPYIIFS